MSYSVDEGRNQSVAARFSERFSNAYLWLRGSIGILAAIGSAWLFCAVAEDVPEKGMLVRVDLAVTTWLQAHGTEPGESIFWTVSLFGAPILAALLVCVAIAFVVRRDWWRLSILGITCGGGAALNALLKLAFHRARPEYAVEFHAASWSFPSGHAMDSLIGYGLLAFWLVEWYPNRRALILVATALIVGMIGYARIYLGVHYASDVLAGFSAGACWLVTCIGSYTFVERRRPASERADGH